MKLKNKKILKSTVLLLLILLLLFGTVGCLRKPSKAEQAVAYMNEKYDDEFTFKHYLVGDSSSIAFLQSKKFPEADVQVVGDKLDDGTYEFWDNYVYCKYEKETREFLQAFFEDVFQCEVKVRYDIGTGTEIHKDSLTNDTTFDEFIHNSDIYVSVILSNEFNFDYSNNKEEIEEKLKKAIVNKDLMLNGKIIFANNEEDFNTSLDVPINELNKLPKLQYLMNGKEIFTLFEWRNV